MARCSGDNREIMSRKILIIEDDEKLNDGIMLALSAQDYQFEQCRLLSEARKRLSESRKDLILLDVSLPDGNGIDFLREIRKSSQVPVLLITVNNMELDIVTGLNAGANDYITKPFSLMVLRARVAVWLRSKPKETGIYDKGRYRFDFEKMLFLKDGNPVELSKTEQRLLRILCENSGATLKRSYLIDEVWQGETEFVDEHALTVTVKRLRDKLEANPGQTAYIKTVYGIGYCWVTEE